MSRSVFREPAEQVVGWEASASVKHGWKRSLYGIETQDDGGKVGLFLGKGFEGTVVE